MSLRRLNLALCLGIMAAACGDDGTGLEAEDLQGTWTATVYEFTDNANAQNVVDVIQRDGATFTLTVDGEGTASTLFDDGVGGSSSDSGTLNSEGTILTLAGVPYSASREGDVLTLVDPEAQFDFGDGSSVAATLRIVMGRQ